MFTNQNDPRAPQPVAYPVDEAVQSAPETITRVFGEVFELSAGLVVASETISTLILGPGPALDKREPPSPCSNLMSALIQLRQRLMLVEHALSAVRRNLE